MTSASNKRSGSVTAISSRFRFCAFFPPRFVFFLHFDMKSRFTSLRATAVEGIAASRFSISRDRNLPLRFCSISITKLRKSSQFLFRSNYKSFFLYSSFVTRPELNFSHNITSYLQSTRQKTFPRLAFGLATALLFSF